MKPKNPSLKRVAKAYRQTHSKPKVTHEGARFFSEGAKPYAIGETVNRMNYKPKAMSITLGGTRKLKPTTIRKRGKV